MHSVYLVFHDAKGDSEAAIWEDKGSFGDQKCEEVGKGEKQRGQEYRKSRRI